MSPPDLLVELLERADAPLPVRRFYGDGDASPLTASLAQVPELLEVTLPFVGAALGAGALSARDKEIAVLRASALLECRYCVRSHTVVALDAGLTPAEVRALRLEMPVDGAFGDERDRTMIGWIDAVAIGRGPVDEVVRAAAAERFADHELVELTLAVTATVMLNRYATALGLPTSTETESRLTAEGFA